MACFNPEPGSGIRCVEQGAVKKSVGSMMHVRTKVVPSGFSWLIKFSAPKNSMKASEAKMEVSGRYVVEIAGLRPSTYVRRYFPTAIPGLSSFVHRATYGSFNRPLISGLLL